MLNCKLYRYCYVPEQNDIKRILYNMPEFRRKREEKKDLCLYRLNGVVVVVVGSLFLLGC